MLSTTDNEMLCRIMAHSPMGAYVREFWVPYMPSDALEAGGAPRALSLLGERLLAFRRPDGKVGVIDEFCPHRRASLALAWNEADGLRCVYHGWQIGCGGEVLDTPTEPGSSQLKSRIPQRGYQCREAGGVLWVYMGIDQANPPAFPEFEWMSLPESARVTVMMQEECNWAQCLEGVIDSAHSNYLHRGSIRAEVTNAKPNGASEYTNQGDLRRPSADGRPTIELDDTPFGFRYAAVRQALDDAGPYVRTTHFIAPIFSSFPAPPGWGHMQMFTPLDDYHTMFYYVRYRLNGEPIDPQLRANFLEQSGLRPGVDVDEEWHRVRNASNLWLQDRTLMNEGTHSGLFGVQTEDAAVQESMGVIVDRSKEHLGRTDRAIMHMRRIMLDAAHAFAEHGEVRFRVEDGGKYAYVRGEERIVQDQKDWVDVGAVAS